MFVSRWYPWSRSVWSARSVLPLVQARRRKRQQAGALHTLCDGVRLILSGLWAGTGESSLRPMKREPSSGEKELPQLLVGAPRRGGQTKAVSAKPPCLNEPIRQNERQPNLLSSVAVFVCVVIYFTVCRDGFCAEPAAVALPIGVEAVRDLAGAYREATPTRERICLNGLWRWQPARAQAQSPPEANWGYFKVPGCWPGITDYMQKDCQTVYPHPSWQALALGAVTAAWYQREITVPDSWAGRRVSIRLEYLNSYSVVFLDGKPVGEIHFPGGELELTTTCRPGHTQWLSLLVVAMPLKGVLLSYTDSAAAREVKGTVERRGLCGDLYLVSTPRGPRLTDSKIETSVRQGECRLDSALEQLAGNMSYRLRATIIDHERKIKEWTSPLFRPDALQQGRMAFTEKWLPRRLWDINTPQNIYRFQLSLLDAAGKVLDTDWSRNFGFREFWIAGRDFFLNGTRLFLSAVPLDNAQVSAATANYAAARESFLRLQSFGINFVYTHNYGCEPGAHLGFEEILRAADDVGMLVSFSQPHFSHYDWQEPDADRTNGYAQHAQYYVRAAQNHPSVVMYSMSHNATGYNEDMNPDLIDGIHAPRDNWAQKNTALALRAEAIVRHMDPSRIVYHHASGNLGSMHAINFYPNFVPIQELSDWFEHWATEGVKPVFLCEYGAPFTWDWTMYRGWYKGQREFGSARVPWEYCVAEWNAQFFGDRAFEISESEKTDLRWEAKQFRAGALWHRWDYPVPVGSTRFEEQYPIFARYLTDNWRAFRTWGVSAVSPWEHEHFWKLREGVDRSRRQLEVDWQHLQRPGFSPDYLDQQYERMDLAFERSDWEATPAAEALLRNNRPLLAYLAGKPAAFTSKDHNFFPGETVEKQLIVVNNSRRPTTCDCQCSFDSVSLVRKRITVQTGQQERIPLRFPAPLPPGRHNLTAHVKFGSTEVQDDTLVIDVLAPPQVVQLPGRIALFDPKGETGALLKRLGIQSEFVGANANLARYDLLIVGKGALTAEQPAPDIGRVVDGLKVLVFEQTSDVLEKRFGFRVEEYGLRQVFARIPDHPVLAGLKAENFTDWRGAATILPPRLTYEMRSRYGVTVQWCGLPVTRLWRCGNRGNLASALIEKPPCGDFLPILDGGYSLQYSPLLEYREGRGVVLFCQVDVTGRTEPEPAAEMVVRNLLRYVSSWVPSPRGGALYAGSAQGKRFLEALGISAGPCDPGNLSSAQALVLGPGAGSGLAGRTAALLDWLKSGGNVLAIGLDQQEAQDLLPFKITMRQAEHISAFFEPFGLKSLFAGLSPAEVHNRDPQQFRLISAGAQIVGDGVLARTENVNVLFCQIPPWQFADTNQANLRRTYRRTAFLVSRLLANMGISGAPPLLDRFHRPVSAADVEQRWLAGLYVDRPQEWDDPYRFFRW